MRTEWRLVRLGDVCEIQLGKMLSAAYQTGKRPRFYLRNANVQWGRFDLSDVYQMDFTEAEEEKFALKAGDLLVCEGGEPGRAAVWNEQIKPCYYQKALHRLRPINEAVDPYFIMYRLWRGVLQGDFLDAQTKNTIAHLPADRLAELEIRLPSIYEQRKISEIISEKLTEVHRLKAAAERQYEAVIAMTGVFLREVFESPEAQGWETVRLGDITEVTSGGTPPRSIPEYYGGAIPWIKTGELLDNVITNAEEHITKLALEDSSTKLFPVGTLLIAMYGQGQTRGRTGVLAIEAATNQACGAILPSEIFDPFFLQLWFQYMYSKLRSDSEGRGGSQSNLSGDFIENLRVPAPHPAKQLEIVELSKSKIDETNRMKMAAARQTEAINALPNAILREVFG